MPRWSDIRVMKFLDIYEKHECLWNPRIEDYKNKYAKDEALDEIIRELNMPGLSRNDIKLKIKSIRTTYKRELTSLLEAQSGKEDQKVAMPRLFWFKRADSFLRAVSRYRRTEDHAPPLEYSNAAIKNETQLAVIQIKNCGSYNHDEYDNSTCSRSYHQNNEKKQPINDTTEYIEDDKISVSYNVEACESTEFMEDDQISVSYNVEADTEPDTKQRNNIQTQSNYRKISEEDEYVVFCKSVAAQLRAIPDLYSRSVAKLKIQQILFEAETGHYKQESYVTVETTQ